MTDPKGSSLSTNQRHMGRNHVLFSVLVFVKSVVQTVVMTDVRRDVKRRETGCDTERLTRVHI